MRKTALLLISLSLLVIGMTPANAQAAAEAGMVSASVAGLASATSHKLDVSKVGGKVTQVTNTQTHRTTSLRTKTTNSQKKVTPTTTAAGHPANQQGHIVSVWPKDALKQDPPQ